MSAVSPRQRVFLRGVFALAGPRWVGWPGHALPCMRALPHSNPAACARHVPAPTARPALPAVHRLPQACRSPLACTSSLIMSEARSGPALDGMLLAAAGRHGASAVGDLRWPPCERLLAAPQGAVPLRNGSAWTALH